MGAGVDKHRALNENTEIIAEAEVALQERRRIAERSLTTIPRRSGGSDGMSEKQPVSKGDQLRTWLMIRCGMSLGAGFTMDG